MKKQEKIGTKGVEIMKYLRLVSLKENALTNIIMQWEIDKYVSKKELLETAYTKIDLLLDCFEKETLLSQLNDMQIEGVNTDE